MGIISWVQFTIREGFVWGGLTRIHFWKRVKGGWRILRKNVHIKNIYLKLFDDEEKIRKKTSSPLFGDFWVPISKKKIGTQKVSLFFFSTLFFCSSKISSDFFILQNRVLIFVFVLSVPLLLGCIALHFAWNEL